MHIISKELITKLRPNSITMLFFVLVLITVSFAVIFDQFFPGSVITPILLAISLISVFAFIISIPFPIEIETGRWRYEVTLDKTYPATKLLDKYDIIQHNGDIWVIEDKEKKDSG